MKIEGYSSKAIADFLNSIGTVTPSKHKENNGDNFNTGFVVKKAKWYAKMVNRIISNKVYIGVLEPGFSAKGRIIAFIDECHRTNSGKLHEAVKVIMPDAILIGFTGTPLLSKDKKNKTSIEVFGPFIHTYKFDEGVKDGVVLDLRYEARDVNQDISNNEKVDTWFNIKTEGLTERAKTTLIQRWTSFQKNYIAQSND